jgi:hypothetical protein
MKCSILILLLISATSFSQNVENKRGEILGRRYAEVELKEALNDQTNQTKIIIGEKAEAINDSVAAISTAEKILFERYGKENIERQKPYQINLIREYWVLFGTLPNDSIGGTFLIILDRRNSNVVKVTHGK